MYDQFVWCIQYALHVMGMCHVLFICVVHAVNVLEFVMMYLHADTSLKSLLVLVLVCGSACMYACV